MVRGPLAGLCPRHSPLFPPAWRVTPPGATACPFKPCALTTAAATCHTQAPPLSTRLSTAKPLPDRFFHNLKLTPTTKPSPKLRVKLPTADPGKNSSQGGASRHASRALGMLEEGSGFRLQERSRWAEFG